MVVAQIFSIIDYFTSTTDEMTITVGLALNGLWIWMIPVIPGLVFVATQTSAGSVKAAIPCVTVLELGEERNVAPGAVDLIDRTRYGTFKRRGVGLPYFLRTSNAWRGAHSQIVNGDQQVGGEATVINEQCADESYELQPFFGVPPLGFDTSTTLDHGDTRTGAETRTLRTKRHLP